MLLLSKGTIFAQKNAYFLQKTAVVSKIKGFWY